MRRDQLIRQLRGLYEQRENVLLVGVSGIGKTTLLRAIEQTSALLLCNQTSSLGRICDCLEKRLNLGHDATGLIARRLRIKQHLEKRQEAVGFDHMSKAPPRVARFVIDLLDRMPVWIACRSDQRKEIGHVWEHLYRFIRIEVPPFTEAETAGMIANAASSGLIQRDAVRRSRELHRISHGVPGALEGLLTELTARKYPLDSWSGLRLLELDWQIAILASMSKPLNSRAGVESSS